MRTAKTKKTGIRGAQAAGQKTLLFEAAEAADPVGTPDTHVGRAVPPFARQECRAYPEAAGAAGPEAPPEAGRRYCQVVVESKARSLDRAFTYALPAHLEGQVRVGSSVRAPFGRQTVRGTVVGLSDEPPGFETREIIEKALDEDPLDEEAVGLAYWLAARYRASLTEALRCVMPPGGAPTTERVVALTEAGRQPGATEDLRGAPNQLALLKALQAQEGVDRGTLARLMGGGKAGAERVAGALRGLIARGLATETRRLRRPRAAPLTRQVVGLVEDDRDWLELVEELSRKAPRQAEVIATLVAAEGGAVPVAELPRDAVRALAKAGLVAVAQERMVRAPTDQGLEPGSSGVLTLGEAQEQALAGVQEALAAGAAATFLLHGVTGSGKTEVYLRSIEAALQAGRSAIVLVPEIALTPQAVGRFRARFGARLALLHSALSAGERFDEWERVRRGEADIVVGARSAIFAPCKRLGVIVVDEEHDGAYKQDSEPRYAAQAVAAERARREGAVLLLGSATPSVEAYYAATSDATSRVPTEGTVGAGFIPPAVRLVELPERVDHRPLPPVRIVDLRREPLDAQGGTFSEALLEALRARVAAGEQSILFLNRRGFSTFVLCRECGHSLRCPDCAVALTYHHKTRRLRCHHCDYDRAVPDLCDNCQGYDVGFHGTGTERVADQVERQVPGAVVLRMDRDTTSRKGAYGDILGRFARGEANVLTGTQMIAKGHDFPNVTLVGVLNADTGLNRPDFRAAEHTFQVLTQVSGRAGRHLKPGEVIVQTYNPDHYAILAAAGHDYAAFYQQELASRLANGYPPFVTLAKISFADAEEETALAVARRAAVALQGAGIFHKRGEVQFLGPAEAPLHKLRGMYRYHVLVKAPDPEGASEAVERMLSALGETGSTRVTVDLDPRDMM